jgi:hypothetical protein
MLQASAQPEAAEDSQSPHGEASPAVSSIAHGCSAAITPASGAPIAKVRHSAIRSSRLSMRDDAITGHIHNLTWIKAPARREPTIDAGP